MRPGPAHPTAALLPAIMAAALPHRAARPLSMHPALPTTTHRWAVGAAWAEIWEQGGHSSVLPEARANMKHTKSKMSSKIRWMSESSLRTAAAAIEAA